MIPTCMYVRLEKGGTTFTANLNFEQEGPNCIRTIHFNPPCSETVGLFTARVTKKIGKGLVYGVWTKNRSRARNKNKKLDTVPPIADAELLQNGRTVLPIADAELLQNGRTVPPIADAELLQNGRTVPPIADAELLQNVCTVPPIADAELLQNGRTVPPIADAELRQNRRTVPPIADAELLQNGRTVPSERTCNDVFFKSGNSNLVLRLLNTDYTIIVNPPWVHSLALPNVILVGCPLCPIRFNASFTKKSESDFQWSVSKDEGEKAADQCSYNPVKRGSTYVPSSADFGHFIKLDCTPKSGSSVGPTISVFSQNRVTALPDVCPFDRRHEFTSKVLLSSSFRVVSYNILAQMYAARKNNFTYCPKYALDMDYRKQLIIEELLGYNADIVCLQEVDAKLFRQDLMRAFSSENFEGLITCKGGTPEGVAIFFMPSRFSLVDSYRVSLGEGVNNYPCFLRILNKLNNYPQVMERILQMTSVLQVSVLNVKDRPKHCLVVGNTHLYAQPAADHIRLIQTGLSMAFINNVISSLKKSKPGLKISLILCGDFNSTPDCGVYKFMTEKHIPADYSDWKSQEGEHVQGFSLNHPFSLASACGTPEFTNYTDEFVGCLDYIFYQTDHLQVEQVVPFPSKEEVSFHTAIPSEVFPSDHVALVADLKWSH